EYPTKPNIASTFPRSPSSSPTTSIHDPTAPVPYCRVIIVLSVSIGLDDYLYRPVEATRQAVRSGVSARSHDFKIRREGGFRSASARTTCQARWPASVTPYWPASLFARSPSDWSFWRWKESLDDESTKFFLRIDTGDVRFDRGVELIELVRCEGDRWTAALLLIGRRGSVREGDRSTALILYLPDA